MGEFFVGAERTYFLPGSRRNNTPGKLSASQAVFVERMKAACTQGGQFPRFYFNSASWNSFQSSRLFKLTASRGAAPSSEIPFAPRIDLRVPSSWM